MDSMELNWNFWRGCGGGGGGSNQKLLCLCYYTVVHGSRQYPYPPHRRSLEILRGGGGVEIVKGKYEAKL